MALWLAPRVQVELKKLLERCTVLDEGVFPAAEDLGPGEMFTHFGGVLGEMTEDAFESLAHVGTFPRPKKATLSEEILRRGLGDMGNCPIPRELWDRLVRAGMLAMRQRILGSHTPPCHRRMVITTKFSVFPRCTAAQTSSVPLQVAADCALALAICTLRSARTHHPPTVPVSL